MKALRISRNLAVLVILAMAVFSSPRPAAAKKHNNCLLQNYQCGLPYNPPCCPGLVCGSLGERTYCQSLSTK